MLYSAAGPQHPEERIGVLQGKFRLEKILDGF